MAAFSMCNKMKAQPGKRDELVRLLLEASEGMEAMEGCELYVIHVSEDDPDAIWVTELWRDADAHAASLRNEAALAVIGRARPLIAGMEANRLKPVGGKGL